MSRYMYVCKGINNDDEAERVNVLGRKEAEGKLKSVLYYFSSAAIIEQKGHTVML